MGTTTQNLICLDFDQTLVNGHFHSLCKRSGISPNDPEYGVQVLQSDGTGKNMHTDVESKHDYQSGDKGAKKDFIVNLIENSNTGPKNPQEMREALSTALANGHKVAITSFTQYPEVVKPTLEAIGLTKDEVEQILIVGGFPSHGKPDGSPDGKKEHIDTAITHFNSKGSKFNYTDVIIVDDTQNNLTKAVEIGIPEQNCVAVPKSRNPDPDIYCNKIKSLTQHKVTASMPTTAKRPQGPTGRKPATRKPREQRSQQTATENTTAQSGNNDELLKNESINDLKRKIENAVNELLNKMDILTTSEINYGKKQLEALKAEYKAISTEVNLCDAELAGNNELTAQLQKRLEADKSQSHKLSNALKDPIRHIMRGHNNVTAAEKSTVKLLKELKELDNNAFDEMNEIYKRTISQHQTKIERSKSAGGKEIEDMKDTIEHNKNVLKDREDQILALAQINFVDFYAEMGIDPNKTIEDDTKTQTDVNYADIDEAFAGLDADMMAKEEEAKRAEILKELEALETLEGSTDTPPAAHIDDPEINEAFDDILGGVPESARDVVQELLEAAVQAAQATGKDASVGINAAKSMVNLHIDEGMDDLDKILVGLEVTTNRLRAETIRARAATAHPTHTAQNQATDTTQADKKQRRRAMVIQQPALARESAVTNEGNKPKQDTNKKGRRNAIISKTPEQQSQIAFKDMLAPLLIDKAEAVHSKIEQLVINYINAKISYDNLMTDSKNDHSKELAKFHNQQNDALEALSGYAINEDTIRQTCDPKIKSVALYASDKKQKEPERTSLLGRLIKRN